MLNRNPPKRKTSEEMRAAYQRQYDRKVQRHKERLASGWKPKPNKPIAKIGVKGLKQKKDKKAALDILFKLHSTGFTFSEDKKWVYADCQLCGRDMIRGYHTIDPCHKVSAARVGGVAPENILGAHRACHDLFDHYLTVEEKQIGIDSTVSCSTGGTVNWPSETMVKFNALKIPLA